MKSTLIKQHPLSLHSSAWNAADLSDTSVITFNLNERHLLAIEHARSQVENQPTQSITREQFDLEPIDDDISSIRDEVLHGRGIALLKGLPVERYSVEDMERIFFGLGTHLGVAVSQSRMGDRIGHVVDASKNHPNERGYRSSRELSLHTDSDDIVMMFCLRPALEGGMNRFVSSVNVYNELCRTAPHLLEPLFDGFAYHWRGEEPEGEPPVTDYKVPVFSRVQDVVSCVFLRAFIEMAAEDTGCPLTELQIEALDKFEEIANSPRNVLNVKLEAGDGFVINNFTVLHSRTAFADPPERTQGRHLLRLWLKSPGVRPLVESVRRYYGSDGIEPREGAGTLYERSAAS